MRTILLVPQTIAAVIVTYNRAEKLMRVLDALVAQTLPLDVIYVIDNASTDDTAGRVAARDIVNLRYIRLPENLGGAGGFHAGMKQAYADGADYLWISDDDAYPLADALKQLRDGIEQFQQQNGYRPSFACSRVEWTDGSLCEMNTPMPVWDWPRFLRRETPWALVGGCSFVSVLVPRWVITDHGLPIPEYFIWFDDAEFPRRIAKSYPGIFCPESRTIHDIAANKGVNYSLITRKTLWKFRYGARNETSFHRRERGMLGVVASTIKIAREMALGRIPWGIRWQIFAAILLGLWFRPAIPPAPETGTA